MLCPGHRKWCSLVIIFITTNRTIVKRFWLKIWRLKLCNHFFTFLFNFSTFVYISVYPQSKQTFASNFLTSFEKNPCLIDLYPKKPPPILPLSTFLLSHLGHLSFDNWYSSTIYWINCVNEAYILLNLGADSKRTVEFFPSYERSWICHPAVTGIPLTNCDVDCNYCGPTPQPCQHPEHGSQDDHRSCRDVSHTLCPCCMRYGAGQVDKP